MAAIEDELWKKIVSSYVVTGPSEAFPKIKQQALARALQEWTASCIQAHLKEIAVGKRFKETDWTIQFQGRKFIGAMREQEVDVSLGHPRAGLVLAVDPKHFQSRDSLGKNWKNGHNDLVAFATNLHERFPLCAIGGVISFPEWAATPQDRRQIYGICSRSIPRERPSNAPGKFEGFALACYNQNGNLIWPFNNSNSPLTPESAFTALANSLYSRTVAIL